MKKIILIAIIVTLNSFVFGQAKIALGIKGGLNFSKLDVSNVTSSAKTGYHAGAYALFKFAKIGIQPEVIFSQQGSVVDLEEWDSKYLNIPLILKYYMIAGVNLQVGPQFGFLSKAELDGQDVKDLLKSSDISLALGFGWDAPFRLSFDARYNLGLSKINDEPGSETIKNQVFQISVGFSLVKFGK